MKAFRLILAVMVFLLCACPVMAGDQLTVTGFNVDEDGDVTAKSVTTTTGAAREVNLPLINFYRDENNSILTATVASTPALVLSATAPYVFWKYGEKNKPSISETYPENRGMTNSTPIFTAFRVPPDYRTGPSFVLTCQNSSVATPRYATGQAVDWDVVIYKNNVAHTTYALYNNTPVSVYGSETGTANAKDGGYADATIDQITLTYSTGSDISAGDVIVFRCWPARGCTSYDATSDFYLFDAVFRYTSQW